VHSFPGAERVMVVGTGGLSHQIHGQRAGLINAEWDHAFLDGLVAHPETVAAIPHVEYLREAGAEGIEMVMWLVMRGALSTEVDEVYRSTHVPTSNTHNGLLLLADRGDDR
jgi:protocatechuate 4,5-dioxygenase beta chain